MFIYLFVVLFVVLVLFGGVLFIHKKSHLNMFINASTTEDRESLMILCFMSYALSLTNS